jgi:hypothetical protein
MYRTRGLNVSRGRAVRKPVSILGSSGDVTAWSLTRAISD